MQAVCQLQNVGVAPTARHKGLWHELRSSPVSACAARKASASTPCSVIRSFSRLGRCSIDPNGTNLGSIENSIAGGAEDLADQQILGPRGLRQALGDHCRRPAAEEIAGPAAAIAHARPPLGPHVVPAAQVRTTANAGC